MSAPRNGSWWELIEWRAEETPNALFCLDEVERSLTFDEYRMAVLRTAAGLYALGVGEGTSVTWVLPTRITALVLMGALGRLSAIQNPVIPIYRQREVGFVTRQTGARLLVVPSRFRSFDYEDMARSLAAEQPGLEVLVVDVELPERDPAGLPPAAPSTAAEDAPIRWIFYTSGTTAEPKGARHTDATLMATSVGLANALDLQPEERLTLVFPVTHIGGPTLVMAGLLKGACQLVVEAFGPGTVDFLSKHGPHHLGSGTVFHNAYLASQRERPGVRLFPNVRTCPSGGAPKPPELHYELKQEIGGLGIISGYGLTECPIITQCRIDDPDEKLAHTEGRPNPPGAEIRVFRRDGVLAAPGEEGELRVKGPQLCKGYLDRDLDEAAFDENGFFRTGDLGFLDEDGFAIITGRLKDVIIRNMENISAKEIEDLLYAHPKVKDVAVVGLPDPKTGERVCAVVVCADPLHQFGFDEMVAYLKGLKMMMQRIPEQLEIVDELPRNPTGKIQKNVLRERYGS